MATVFKVFLLKQIGRLSLIVYGYHIMHSTISVKQATIGTVFLENLTQGILFNMRR
jgi:hypothetical protein